MKKSTISIGVLVVGIVSVLAIRAYNKKKLDEYFEEESALSTAGKKISSVTFTFTSAQSGTHIDASTKLSDSSGNVHENTPLHIELKYQSNGDGTYTPYFTITPKWDATSN